MVGQRKAVMAGLPATSLGPIWSRTARRVLRSPSVSPGAGSADSDAPQRLYG